MNKVLIILVAAAVLAFQCSQAQFSFSLPGNWGNGKRAFNFALPGRWGNVKRNSIKCNDLDRDTVMNIYKAIQQEAVRIVSCFGDADSQEIEKDKH